MRLRTKVTSGPGSRAAGLAMTFKLIESAQERWRAVNAPHLVALVRAGATFVNGHLVEPPDPGGRRVTLVALSGAGPPGKDHGMGRVYDDVRLAGVYQPGMRCRSNVSGHGPI